MTARIRKLYKSACRNDKFLQAIKQADGDSVPKSNAEELEKYFFAAVYYGWLVSEHGILWEDYI